MGIQINKQMKSHVVSVASVEFLLMFSDQNNIEVIINYSIWETDIILLVKIYCLFFFLCQCVTLFFSSALSHKRWV